MVCTTLEYHVLVTLPLWVLSVTFHLLLPLAITSLLISVGVCVAAGAQAALPRNEAALVVASAGGDAVLPPADRARLGALPGPPAACGPRRWRRSRRSIPSRCATASNRCAKSNTGPSSASTGWRLAADILRRLDQQGWPNKADIGWSDYDVEVYDTRWSKLQLTTVAEEHPQGKQLIRCRLRARWALRAKVAFWSLCGFELLVCGLVGPRLPWLWLLLLTLPLFAWFLRRQQRNLQSMIVVFLDELAKEWHLTKVQTRTCSAAARRTRSRRALIAFV